MVTLHHGDREGPLSMVWTVTVLAALAAVGGFLQFSPIWSPLTRWLAPVAAPVAEASSWQEGVASGLGVALGVAGILVAYQMYAARAWRVPKPWPVLERLFYVPELYDLAFYRVSVLASRLLGRFVERPVIGGSIGEITAGFRLSAGGLSRAQNGLVRSYALALAAGVAVLAVVFLAVR